MDEHAQLVDSLRDPERYDHTVENISVRETHISSIVLTGPFAYKIKKPVQFDFLDFSTLKKRKYFCLQEIRLNRRLCPDLYREVVSISGPPEDPRLNEEDNVQEYAVKMVQFSENNLFSQLAESDDLTKNLIDELVNQIVDFQQSIESNPPSDTGTFETIKREAEKNFVPFEDHTLTEAVEKRIDNLEEWTRRTVEERQETIRDRRESGYVRHGHGDMHLGNIVRYKGNIRIFDCIEFNEQFRWIDVINELAFLVMDLFHRGFDQLAFRLINHYLEQTGDYSGTKVLRFYSVYRAMVRAKVNFLDENRKLANQYLNTAESFISPTEPGLIITHGLSGSGKTTVTDQLVESLGAIRIRSDVERKRLANIPPTKSPDPSRLDEIYSTEMTKKTYERLRKLAEAILEAGFTTIVDATFLKQKNRKLFQTLAESLEINYRIIDFEVDEATLRKRLKDRASKPNTASDADVEVLEEQIEMAEPLTNSEDQVSVTLDENTDLRTLVEKLEARPKD